MPKKALEKLSPSRRAFLLACMTKVTSHYMNLREGFARSRRFRRNMERAHKDLGIKYVPLSNVFPLWVRVPYDMWFRATFPDGETMKIHLTKERSYEDIDVAAHLGIYARFTSEIFPKLDSELKGGREPIVDCACGSGYGTNFISSELGKPVIGIDVDTDAIAYARKRYGSTRELLSFIQANAMDLGVIDTQSICSVVSVETIEHIQDPDKVLDEFSRILDPRGVLFITTPDGSDRPSTLVSRYHVREYTFSAFSRLLRGHFPSVDVCPSGFYLVGVCRKR